MLPPKLQSDMMDLRTSPHLRKAQPWLCKLAAIVFEVWTRHCDLRLALCDARKEINGLKAEVAQLRAELNGLADREVG